MEQEQEVLPTEAIPTEQTAEEEVAPTKSVKNFWERLDEVFVQNTELRERMEDLVSQFPDSQKLAGPFQSYLFQPERILISSNDDITPALGVSSATTNPTSYIPRSSSYFNSFRVRFKRPLLGVKSVQMLSAVIPNALQNIPDNSTVFYYYKIRSVGSAVLGTWLPLLDYVPGDIVLYLGQYYVSTSFVTSDVTYPITPGVVYWTPANFPGYTEQWEDDVIYGQGAIVFYEGKYWEAQQPLMRGAIPGVTYWVPINLPGDPTVPNYADLANPASLQVVRLTPSTLISEAFPLSLNFNRTFADYDDLVNSLNYCATLPTNASTPNEVSFSYDPVLNKISFVPSAAAIAAGSYFLPAGYLDPNITTFLEGNYIPSNFGGVDWTPQYTLNLRLGFTWNGVLPPLFAQDNYTTNTVANTVYPYLRPKDPRYLAAPFNQVPWIVNATMANSYGDLVNTSCVRVYADVIFGSTQDSNNTEQDDAEGLLSLVPINATNLGVGFYQNNFNNALTKIPPILSEIGIRLINDQGLAYNLPNSATVLLELAVEYK